ncbi:hypothetical protein ACN6MY_13000 [Peribacillus sp. B-H-3]|uniref:hypothetical protein n=1 Tax=Peribacillus sp. B-H-3 TaxID=3400420 RepID=UPI003B02C5E5
MKTELSSLIQQVGENTEQLSAYSIQLTASAEQTSQANEDISNTIQEPAEKQFTSIEETSQVVQNVSQIVDLID